MKKKTALIFGISGQDGAYLADFLLRKKYIVYGITRSNSKKNLFRLKKLNIHKKVFIIQNREISLNFLKKIKKKIKYIHELYYLSGETSPENSILKPLQTFEGNVNNLILIFEFIRSFQLKTKVFYASSSEIFKNVKINNFNENSELGPRTPYAISKATGLWLIKYYRNYHNIFCSSGILFNHESPLRSNKFVFKKIINETKKLSLKKRKFYLGNIKIKRDIGWAPDYVRAMWKMLQLKKPCDLVIGSGKSYSIKEFLDLTLKSLNLDKKRIILNSKQLIRKNDIKDYKSNPKLAKKLIKWKNTLTLRQIINKMINNEYY